jgi:hypothetical protein
VIRRPRKSSRKVRNRPEQEQQIALFRWAALAERDLPALRLLFHCPNGGRRNKVEAAILRAMGVKSGVPDVWLPVAGILSPRGLVMEFKAPGTAHRRSASSPQQREWIELLRAEGWHVLVVDDWSVARQAIHEHLIGRTGGL